jgi:hypothetical protein
VRWTGTNYAGFEALTAVVMKISIFWDITPCSPLKANRQFGRIYRLNLHGRRINQARNQNEAGSKPKIETTCSTKTSVDLKRTTLRYIPEDRTLQVQIIPIHF